jgi:hypothetical protein
MSKVAAHSAIIENIFFFQLTVNYSGCNPNNNRFVEKEHCENACKHRANQKRTEVLCNLPILSGNCDPGNNSTLAKWGYHTRLRRCVPSYHTGCGGNENVFETREDCEAVCPTTFSPLVRLPRGSEVLAKRGSLATTLQVSIRANPQPNIEWFHNGRALSKYAPRYTMMADSSLQISNVTDMDAGTYLVKADNGIGKVASEATLDLIVYPLYSAVEIKAEKTLYAPGEDAMLPCEVRGYPPPTIKVCTWTWTLHFGLHGHLVYIYVVGIIDF